MYIDFMTQYWYLFAMLFVILLLLSFDPGGKGAAAGSKAVSPAQIPQLQSRENAVIVDVSEEEQFKEGHISQAINLPLSKLADSLGKLKKHESKPIVLTCAAGNSSKKAVSILQKNEFKNIYMLSGGLAAWRKENFPLVKG